MAKDHYVPRFYLRNFQIPGQPGLIYSYAGDVITAFTKRETLKRISLVLTAAKNLKVRV